MDGAFPSSLGEGEGERRRGFRGTQENAKTKLCLRWKSGHCRFGDACNFAHGEEELRQLPPRNFNSRGGGGGGRGFGGYDSNYSQGGFRGGSQQIEGAAYYRGGGRGPGQAEPQGISQSAYNEPRPQGAARAPGDNDAWAAQGYPVPGPNGWTQYTTLDTAEPYYHNHVTGETVWDKPSEWR